MQAPTQLMGLDQGLSRQVFNEMMSRTRDGTKSVISHQVWYKDTENKPNLITPHLLELVSMTHQLLNKEGYICNQERWFVESHYYCATGTKLESPLTWHQDNNGGWPEKEVVTAIYYLKKDKDLLGGDLLYSLENKDPDSIIYPWFFKSTNKKYPSVRVETGLTVLMSGELWHCPESMYGSGERELIVIQLPREI